MHCNNGSNLVSVHTQGSIDLDLRLHGFGQGSSRQEFSNLLSAQNSTPQTYIDTTFSLMPGLFSGEKISYPVLKEENVIKGYNQDRAPFYDVS